MRNLVQQHCQAQRSRLSLSQPPQHEILRHATVQHHIYQQNIPALELRFLLSCRHCLSTAEKNLAPRSPTLFDVLHILPKKMNHHGCVNCPNQIRREHKSAIHRHHDVQPPPVASRGDFSPQALYLARNPPGCVAFHTPPGHDFCSNVITTPDRVSSFTANSVATLRPC